MDIDHKENLMSKFLAGELNDAEKEELAVLLDKNPEMLESLTELQEVDLYGTVLGKSEQELAGRSEKIQAEIEAYAKQASPASTRPASKTFTVSKKQQFVRKKNFSFAKIIPYFAVAASIVFVSWISWINLKDRKPTSNGIGAVASTTGASFTVIRGQETIVVDDSIELQLADKVSTDNSDVILKYNDKLVRVEVYPNSQLNITDKHSPDNKVLNLVTGKIRASVNKKKGQVVKIVTTHAEAIVVGTKFQVETNEKGTELSVFQGQIKYINSKTKQYLMVGAGKKSTVSAGVKFAVAPISSSGLVAYWKFDEATAKATPDSSGNNHTAKLECKFRETKNPKIDISQDIPTSIKFPNIGSLKLLGKQKRICLKAAADSQIQNLKNFSISFWYKAKASQKGTIIQKQLGNGQESSFRFYIAGKGNSKMLFVSPDNEYIASVPSQGKWNHVLGTWDGKEKKLFINGKFTKEYSSPEPKPITFDAHPITIGAASHVNYDFDFFRGKIDDVRIFNRVLNEKEINQLSQGMSF